MESLPGGGPGRLQFASTCTCIQPPVKLSLHTVISKKDFNDHENKKFPTTVKPAFIPEIPLQLGLNKKSGMSWLHIFKLKSTRLLKEVSIYCKWVSLKAKDAQGKEFKEEKWIEAHLLQDRWGTDLQNCTSFFLRTASVQILK